MVVPFRRHSLLPLVCPHEGGELLRRPAGADPAVAPVGAAPMPLTAWKFLEYLLKVEPYRIHTILND